MANYPKELIVKIQAEMKAAADAIAKKHGLTVTSANGTYGNSLAVKFEFSAVDASGERTDLADRFRSYASLYGIDPKHLGKTFTYGGNTYKLAGMRKMRASRRLDERCFVIINTATGKEHVANKWFFQAVKFN